MSWLKSRLRSALAYLRRRGRRALRCRFLRLQFEALEYRWAPAILTVNSLADGAVKLDDATVTLRDAIEAANTDAQVSPGGPSGGGADEIRFQAGLSGVIVLNQGQLALKSNLTLTGPGASLLTVSGNSLTRIFNVSDLSSATVITVTISGLSILNGKEVGSDGGGLINRENLTVQSCIISSNSAEFTGGGIANSSSGNLTIRNSTISGNQAGGGGGITNLGILTVQNSTITGNSAGFSGGGISAGGTLIVQNSTISGNFADAGGGGISTSGDVPVTIQNSTISQNHANNDNNSGSFEDGGGIFVDFRLVGTTPMITLHNTIIANNFKGSGTATENDIQGIGPTSLTVSGTSNLIGTGGSGGLTNGANGNKVGVADPKLGPLADNGGPTRTHALLSGSPAVDAGNNDQAPSFSTFDQRGDPFVRVANGKVDIGSYEATLVNVVVDTNADEDDGNLGIGDLSLREAINLTNATAAGGTITFAAGFFSTPRVITLGLGQLAVSSNLTLVGPGAGLLTINGQSTSRLFDLASTVSEATFDGLTLTLGRTTANGQRGPAINSNSTGQLTVKNSTISGNSTAGTFSGGAIFTTGSLTLTDSTVAGNSTAGASSRGGGISAASVTIINSTISGNSTAGNFSDGGGVFAIDAVLIINSTVFGNSIGGSNAFGGGVHSSNGPVTIRNSIIAGNLDTQDGSHPDLSQPNNGPPTVQFSLIGDNNNTGLAASPSAAAPNFNLIGTHAALLNPQLGPLVNNGGPTQTHALCTAASSPDVSCTAASPALNAGNNLLVPADALDLDGDGDFGEPIPFEQRGFGFLRVFNSTVDMGSFEAQAEFPWHNFVKPLDVRGGNSVTPDNSVDAGDALAIINYINAFDPLDVPANAEEGLPFGFLDVIKDNVIAPEDALTVINAINAEFGGEAESGPMVPNGQELGANGQEPEDGEQVSAVSSQLSANLMALLAADAAQLAGRRRRA